VTELSTTETSPAEIVDKRRSLETFLHRESAERELAYLRKQRKPPPQLSGASLDSVTTDAEAIVRRDEGLLRSIYRSFIDDTVRHQEIAAVAVRLNEEALAAHRAAISLHTRQQQELDAKIAASESTLCRVPTIVEREIQKLFDEAKLVLPTKSKEQRLLRAFFIGLIDFERTEHKRPETSEYEEQKKRIRARDGYRCVCCLRGFAQGELHVHHVLPLSRFGTNSDSNLVTLCHPCHNKQHPGFQVTRSFPIRRRPSTYRFVAVDIETTGLSNEDSIIEIAAVRFVGGQVEEVYRSLVRSKKVIPAKVTQLTGITQSMIAEAPHPGAVIRDFVAFISTHRLVFHNASFDMRFIGKYLKYFGYPLPDRILDTLPLARKKLPALSSHRLAHLVEHLGLPVARSHRALDDSLATGHLYLALRDIPSPRAKKKPKRSKATPSKQPNTVSTAS
jgi:DNA polymerase III epsilon subunit family exonuclease